MVSVIVAASAVAQRTLRFVGSGVASFGWHPAAVESMRIAVTNASTRTVSASLEGDAQSPLDVGERALGGRPGVDVGEAALEQRALRFEDAQQVHASVAIPLL